MNIYGIDTSSSSVCRLTAKKAKSSNNNGVHDPTEQERSDAFRAIKIARVTIDTTSNDFSLVEATNEVKRMLTTLNGPFTPAHLTDNMHPLLLGFLHHPTAHKRILDGFAFVAQHYALPNTTVAEKTVLKEYLKQLSNLVKKFFQRSPSLALKIMKTIQQDDPFGTIPPDSNCIGLLVDALMYYSHSHNNTERNFTPASMNVVTMVINGNNETFDVGGLFRFSFAAIRSLVFKCSAQSRAWILMDNPKHPEDDRDVRGNLGKVLYHKYENYITESDWNPSLPPIDAQANPDGAALRSRYRMAAQLVQSVRTALDQP